MKFRPISRRESASIDDHDLSQLTTDRSHIVLNPTTDALMLHRIKHKFNINNIMAKKGGRYLAQSARIVATLGIVRTTVPRYYE